MGNVPAGWHPDPANPQSGLRWWDGGSWTSYTQPRPAATPMALQAQPAAAPMALQAQPAAAPVGLSSVPPRVLAARPSGAGVYDRNRTTVAVLGIVALYLLLAAATHIVLLGILPVTMSLRAVRRREPFAAVAVIAAVVSVVVAVGALMH